MTEIMIDISKLKPFNCRHYQYPTYLSISSCLGYCLLEDNLSLKYCKGNDCEEYEKMELEE